MTSILTTIRQHPFVSSLVAATAAAVGIYAFLPRIEYSTVAEATVLEERLLGGNDEKGSSQQHYLLHLDVAEEQEHVFYTLHVKPNPAMPVEVLDDIISSGTKIIIPHQKVTGRRGPLYDITRFGTIDSAAIKVVRPWESSERVMEEHGETIERQRRIEERNRQRELAGYTRSDLF